MKSKAVDIKQKITILLLVLAVTYSNAQNSEENAVNKESPSYSVNWVFRFPSEKHQKKGWLTRFLFGKKNTFQITKPVSIIALDSSTYTILDQGAGVIFSIKESKSDVLKAFKRSKLQFNSLVGVCKLPNQQLLFTDSRLNTIYEITKNKKQLLVFNKQINLQQPTGIAYSTTTNEVWVVETKAHRISVLTRDGKLVKTIGKRGIAKGEFNYPTAIWIDKRGNVYVVDAMNFRIQIFNLKGEVISVFGEAGNATGYFARPKGIATDSHHNIYITDALYHTVQVFDFSGNFLYKFGTQGRGNGEFWMPSGIYIDEKDYIYVADSYNASIQVFKLNTNE